MAPLREGARLQLEYVIEVSFPQVMKYLRNSAHSVVRRSDRENGDFSFRRGGYLQSLSTVLQQY
jgi:hypothetical protein